LVHLFADPPIDVNHRSQCGSYLNVSYTWVSIAYPLIHIDRVRYESSLIVRVFVMDRKSLSVFRRSTLATDGVRLNITGQALSSGVGG
jgi:hypothetical protein